MSTIAFYNYVTCDRYLRLVRTKVDYVVSDVKNRFSKNSLYEYITRPRFQCKYEIYKFPFYYP